MTIIAELSYYSDLSSFDNHRRTTLVRVQETYVGLAYIGL